ncbi:hypothetical protein ACP70R_049604 [Stipagrostis hirtigluma subsp. patula]
MEPAVSCSLGAMGTLLAQLEELTKPGQRLPLGTSKSELEGLTKDLKEISAAIMDLSKEGEPSLTDKCWMKEVREICYDAEDYLHSSAVFRGTKGQSLIAEDISELRASLQDARRRHERCKLPELMRTRLQQDAHRRRERCRPAVAEFQTFVKSMLQTPGAVLDQPMDELVDLLAFDGEPQLKVVPIFGFAGVGKTTLATRLYHLYGTRFHCRAFLRVSRNPDTRRLLTSLLSQIKGPRPQGRGDVQDLTNMVHEHLQGKAYLIIVDDLWTTSVWDIISRSFPDGDNCSRIITITQIKDVALSCCGHYSNNMYEMRPLSADEPQQLSFGDSEGMKEVLNIIYNNLPDHLKTCLLYLNIYPEDYVIWKDDLVKQWGAERIICDVVGQDREELAGSYFDALVASGMIQTVETNYNNEVLSCTVHHMVLDLIARKSMEENFVTVVEYFETVTGFPDKVRRLSLKFGGSKSAQLPGNFRMTHVRSLLFSGFFRCVPSIGKYKFLRVLFLHIWADKEKMSFDLAPVGKLFLLKYLKVVCNVTVKLPAQMQGLELLETLEVDATTVAVPFDIVRLHLLLHLLLPNIVMPDGIDQMISLRTLGFIDLGCNLGDNFLSLGQLTNLQYLQLTCCSVASNHLFSNMERLVSILGKISCLRSLVLAGVASSSTSITYDGFSNVSPHPALLERLELSPRICVISFLPRWIRELSKLHVLKIALRELLIDDFDILKGLPALATLSMYVRTVPAERIIINKDGFPVLQHFKFICAAPCVEFVEGAMLNVRKLKLGFNVNTIEQCSPVHAGFKHLTSLEVFSANIGGAGVDDSRRKFVQSALVEAFTEHPSPPIINIKLVDSIFHKDKEMCTASHGPTHQTAELDSREGTDKQADSRITQPLGCSSHTKDPESSSYTKILGEDKRIRMQEKNSHIIRKEDLIIEQDTDEPSGMKEKESGEDTTKQLDLILEDTDEPPGIEENESGEDTNKQNVRASIASSSHMQNQGPGLSEMVCSRCPTLLVYNRGVQNIRCPDCWTVNSTRSGANQVSHLSCGQCRMILAYQLGASHVGCPGCRFVNLARDNSRGPDEGHGSGGSEGHGSGGSAAPAPHNNTEENKPQVTDECPASLTNGIPVNQILQGVTEVCYSLFPIL